MEHVFVSAYSPKNKVGIEFPGKGRTKQAHKDECDINRILAKYIKTGILNHYNKYGGSYGDFTSVDFHEAMNLVAEAQEMFDELPAKARSKFENDPGKFLDFVQDEANAEQLYDLGLSDVAPGIRETKNQEAEPVEPPPAET